MNAEDFNRRHLENARRLGMPAEEAVRRMTKAMQPYVDVDSTVWAPVFALSFGKPMTVDEWRATRPRLWRLRSRWAWADQKPYEHIWTPVGQVTGAGPVYTHTFSPVTTSTTWRDPPPEGTLRRAWWDVGEALGAALRATWHRLRAIAVRSRRAVRGR